nr:hypothetical protein [Escherichia coli]
MIRIEILFDRQSTKKLKSGTLQALQNEIETVPRKKSLKQKVCSSMPVVILENVCRKWHGKDGWKTAWLFTAHWLKRDYGCVFSMVTWLSVTVMIITVTDNQVTMLNTHP